MSRRTFGTVRYRDDRMAFFIQFTWLGRQHQRRVCSATGEVERMDPPATEPVESD